MLSLQNIIKEGKFKIGEQCQNLIVILLSFSFLFSNNVNTLCTMNFSCA
jgi:hypothetical protein